MLNLPYGLFVEAAFAQVTAAQAACATIAFRLPILAQAAAAGDASAQREARLMVREKVAAAIEGSVAGTLAMQTVWLDMAFGRMTPARAVTTALAVATAASAPGHRRAAANAKRLTRRAAAGARRR